MAVCWRQRGILAPTAGSGWYGSSCPLTLPGIIAGCLLVFLPAMGMFYVSDLLGGAKHLLIGNLVKTQFLNSRDWPFGAAISVMLTVLMALLVYCYSRAGKLLSKKGELA